MAGTCSLEGLRGRVLASGSNDIASDAKPVILIP